MRLVGIVRLLDQLPEAICQSAEQLWSVLARSLGEQGADGRTALAWRWALTGTSPSPVALSPQPGRPPGRDELIREAEAPAELSHSAADPGGQVMHARFVLSWLAGDLDALPLWNGRPGDLHITDGAACPRTAAEIEEVCSWALLAQWRHRWPDEPAAAGASTMSGRADGMAQLLDWVCGMTGEGPLAGLRVPGRPSLYQVSLEVCQAMSGLVQARETGSLAVAGRMEAFMETFAWLSGWSPEPPVDRHGHGTAEDCPERAAPCGCHAVGRCLAGGCQACCRVPCVHGFGQDDAI